MTNKNDALFSVKLPFGQKTIPYEDVPELIAMAKSPGYDIEKASGDEDVSFVLSVGLEERPLRAAVHAGEVEVLNKSLHRIDPPFRGRLEDTVLTVRALREYVESIHGNLEVADAPELKATTPSPAPVVATDASGGEVTAPNWRMQIQAEAYELWLRFRANGCNPSVYSICDDMAAWYHEKY